MFWEGTRIIFCYQYLIFLGNSKFSFPTEEGSRLGAIEYEDCYAIGKYVAIHRTAAALRKFKKSHSHYGLTESSIRTSRDKYRRIVKSFPATKTIT